MLIAKKSQMLFIEGQTGQDLADQYNAAMATLAERQATVTEKIIDSGKLSAIILYDVTEKIPQSLKDRLELKGIRLTCSECPLYEPLGGGSGWCPRLSSNSSPLRGEDDICRKRWQELEMEEEERRVSHGARSQAAS